MSGVLLSVLLIVLPVFLVIGAGYATLRVGFVDDAVIDALTAFATRIAVPTLLFTRMASLSIGDAFDPGMLIAFYAGALIAAVAALAAARFGGVSAPKAVTIGLAASFSNTVLIGVPVLERAYDAAAVDAMLAIISMHIPILLTLGMVAMAISRADAAPDSRIGAALATVAGDVARNPFMIGLALGLLVNLSGLAAPAPIASALDMVARAALPTALFALGGALTRYAVKDEIGWASLIVAFSLLAHPAIAYGLGAYVFALEPRYLRAAVVAAAMPSGLNVYVFAALHRTGEGVAASAVVLGTALAVVTASFWLVVLGGVA